MNADFILAIGELGKEKGIDPELLFQAVEEALVRILVLTRMSVLI